MRITINGIYLNVKVIGNGKPLVLLHGNEEDLTIFNALANKLKTNYKLYLVDSRNHGKSETTDVFDYDQMACDLIELVVKLEIKPDVIGFSDGAITALKAAILSPNLFNKLHLLGVNTSVDGIEQSLINDLKSTTNPYELMMLKMNTINSKDIRNVKNKVILHFGSNDVITKNHIKYLHQTFSNVELYIYENHDHASYINSTSFYKNIINNQ